MSHRCRTLALTLAVALLAVLPVLAAGQNGNAAAAPAAPADHGIFSPDAVKFQDGPPSLEKGAKFAVLEGNPAQEGLFTMRLWLPDGFQIKPHSHPAVEHVTVVSGTFNVGMGDTFDASKGAMLPTGTFAFLAPGMHHYAWATGDTVVQLHGVGPWQINYVNPADDPRQKTQ
jgi:quercetin dioxygenase-like cupin family protein